MNGSFVIYSSQAFVLDSSKQVTGGRREVLKGNRRSWEGNSWKAGYVLFSAVSSGSL